MSLNASSSSSRSRTKLPATALALLVGLALASRGAEALAVPPEAPGHAEAMADARFKSGLAAYDRADYEAARLEFLQAQAIFPRASLYRNLALSELHSNRPLDALQHLRAYIADPATTPDKRALAERNIAEAFAQTGHLSISAPAGAHVKVDGKEVGVAPLKEAVDVVPGLHGVDTEANGTSLHETVQAGAGKLTEVAFVGPVVGDTHVVGVPGGPAVLPPVGPGATREAPPVVGEHHYWNSRRTVGVILAGVGAAGMAVGGVFGSMRGSQTTNATTAQATVGANPSACFNPPASLVSACSSLSNALGSNGTDAQLEQSLLIGGGVMLAVGLLTTFWPAGGGVGADTAMPPVAPTVGPHGGGLSWTGSF